MAKCKKKMRNQIVFFVFLKIQKIQKSFCIFSYLEKIQNLRCIFSYLFCIFSHLFCIFLYFCIVFVFFVFFLSVVFFVFLKAVKLDLYFFVFFVFALEMQNFICIFPILSVFFENTTLGSAPPCLLRKKKSCVSLTHVSNPSGQMSLKWDSFFF